MKTGKIVIAAVAVTLGVIIGIVYMNFMEADYINEDEVRAIVTDRYQGDISNVSLSENDDYFLVTVENEQYLYEITINRAESTVEDIKSSENPDYVAEKDTEETTSEESGTEESGTEGSGSEESGTEDSGTEESSSEGTDQKEEPAGDNKQGEGTSDETASESGSSESPSNESEAISMEEARDIAMNEVGGLYLHSTLNEEVSPSEYLIANLIDGDDEGAIVSVNAVNGTVNKVIFLDIEFDEIGDLESFMRQVASYNAQNQHYYIEYDDDDDWDDDDDDDWDDD